REIGDVDTCRTSERKKSEAPCVITALDRDKANSFRHRGVDDRENPARGGDAIVSELLCNSVDCLSSRFPVKLHRSVGEAIGVEIAKDQIVTGHSRLVSAAAVAGRPRQGSHTLRPDPKNAARIDLCDRTPA